MQPHAGLTRTQRHEPRRGGQSTAVFLLCPGSALGGGRTDRQVRSLAQYAIGQGMQLQRVAAPRSMCMVLSGERGRKPVEIQLGSRQQPAVDLLHAARLEILCDRNAQTNPQPRCAVEIGTPGASEYAVSQTHLRVLE